MSAIFEAHLPFAQQLDRQDTLNGFRSQFHFPTHQGKNLIYFCGNSLGLQPRNVETLILQELKDWRDLAVGGYRGAKNPWLYYQHQFCTSLSDIVGCTPVEITVMNALTVNLHLMMLTFYHPTPQRYQVLMEGGAFPSDQYAVETQVRFHGLDPAKTILEISPRPGEKIIREEDILSEIDRHKKSLALVIMGGIHYYSGQWLDIPLITEATHKAGAIAGFDLAHAAGNVPLRLHDWQVDFAVWCSYKYLNGGPGASGGVYLHEKYARDPSLTRLGGWWGNEEDTRFEMQKGFVAKSDASGWNMSTAPVLNMVALKASLELFALAGMDKIREKSCTLTAFLEFLLSRLDNIHFEIITPRETNRRGSQLSLFFRESGKEVHHLMLDAGIVADYREPGVIRLAPAPLYNSFEDVYQLYALLKKFRPSRETKE